MKKYMDFSKKSFDIDGVSTQFKGTVYNIGVLATGLYPIELSVGSVAPFASIGAVYIIIAYTKRPFFFINSVK